MRYPNADPSWDPSLISKWNALLQQLTLNDNTPIFEPRYFKTVTTTWDPPNLTNNSSSTFAVSVALVKDTDIIIPHFAPISVTNWQLDGYSGTNRVFVTLQNRTGGTVNLGPGLLTLDIFRLPR